MPSLRELRRHVASVESIAKITNAMEVVSSARVHRLRSRAEATHPFAVKSWEVLSHLASASEAQIQENPLFCGYGQAKSIGMLLITSERAMVGAYNHNIISFALEYAHSQQASVEVITLGRAGRAAMLREGCAVHADLTPPGDRADIASLSPVARVVVDGFAQRTFEQVTLVYTQFQEGVRLQPTARQLLPLCPTEESKPRQYIYEPDPVTLIQELLPRIIRFQIYQAYLESLLAENTARMAAMHTATQNAEQLIDRLTLSYNKARQEAVTAEILEILVGSLTGGGS